MRNLKMLLAAGTVLALTGYAFAQIGQGTQTWWNASRADTANLVNETAASATTVTLTPQAGQSVYVQSVKVTNCASGSAVTAAAVTTITTTNMGGLTYQMGSGSTAGGCVQDFTDAPGGTAPLKAAAPGPVTFVTPTFATNQTIRMSIRWYSAL